MSAIDRKFEKNNTRLEIMIDKKLDKIVYEEHRKSFEAWTNEKDKILENKINKNGKWFQKWFTRDKSNANRDK